MFEVFFLPLKKKFIEKFYLNYGLLNSWKKYQIFFTFLFWYSFFLKWLKKISPFEWSMRGKKEKFTKYFRKVFLTYITSKTIFRILFQNFWTTFFESFIWRREGTQKMSFNIWEKKKSWKSPQKFQNKFFVGVIRWNSEPLFEKRWDIFNELKKSRTVSWIHLKFWKIF